MRVIFRYLIIVSLSLAAVFLLGSIGQSPSVSAASEPLSDEQRVAIKSQCSQIKSSLGQLHASDALLRVNRGQVYESLSSKIMYPFVARLSSNGLDSKALNARAAQYKHELSQFRADYILYEQKLSETLRVDCRQKPEDFYRVLMEARSLRQVVHKDVQNLHRTIDDYGVSVRDFSLNFQRVAE